MSQRTIIKFNERAQQFNLEDPIPLHEANQVYDSLGISLRERAGVCKCKGQHFSLENIQMHGVYSLSDEDIKEYFQQYTPEGVERCDSISTSLFPLPIPNDTSIVKFKDELISLRAMMKMSDPIGEPKEPERITKFVVTGDGEPEMKTYTRQPKEEFANLVHPDKIPIDIPAGKWRLGKPHNKCEAILLRFGQICYPETIEDSKQESKEILHKPKHNKTKKKSIQNKAKKKQTAVMRKQNPSSNTSIKLISFP